MKHVGSTNFYPFGFNLEKSGRDFFYIQRREWAVDRRFPNFKSRNLIQIPDTNHSPVSLRSKLHARVGTEGNRVIVKGRMGRSNESAAVSKERDLRTNYDIVIRKSQRWSRCSGHDQSKTLVGKELNFSKLYWHLITRKDCRLILSHTIHIVYCVAVALLESWGILGNIVFKILCKLQPALTHRPTLTLSSMLRFFSRQDKDWITKDTIGTREVGEGKSLLPGGGGVLLGILGEGVPPGSSNPDPISDQKMWFSSLVFTLDL